jgi:CheY-like chemotaxis protein
MPAVGRAYAALMPFCIHWVWARDGAAANVPFWEWRKQMVREHPFVLVVEDDERLRSVIVRNLWARGYIVLEAGSFRDAIDRTEIKPGVIILDINLPDASGWDVAEWLDTQNLAVPVIAISGYVTPTREQMQHYHPAAFLPKPFTIDKLMRLVEEYTTGQHLPLT